MFSTIFTLKRVLLLILAFWFSVVFLTNAFDLLKAAGIFPMEWKFASDKFEMIRQTTLIYNMPGWLNVILFISMLIWEGFIAVLFFKAFFSFKSLSDNGSSAVNAAFFCSISMWGAFIIFDELFKNYSIEVTHFALFIMNLISLLIIKLIPAKEPVIKSKPEK
ncbi:hypothetical protein ACFLSV_03340 [Bacteroidota bacterium]